METTEARLGEARQALRERQGGGARWDAPKAPHANLSLARRGVAYFARQLNGLSRADLSGPTPWCGKSRQEIAARVSYFARALAADAARMRGAASDEAEFPHGEIEEIVALAATLPEEALRYLVDHSAIHLNCEWRDLADEHWVGTVSNANSMAQKPLLWAWANWLGAIAIGPLARVQDLPNDLRQAAAGLEARLGSDPLAGTILQGLTMDAVRGDRRMDL